MMFFFFDFSLYASLNVDRPLLTTLVAWERLFGCQPLRWDELSKRGLTLNREEATRYVKSAEPKLPPERQALYELLFDQHPELKIALFSPQEILEKLDDNGRPEARVFGGVDVGQDRFFPCVLNLDAKLGGPQLEFAHGELGLRDTISWLIQRGVGSVCIDGPPQPNTGALAARLPPEAGYNVDRRVAEFQLGIGGCYGTPSVRPDPHCHNAWMLSSMNLFDYLSRCLAIRIDLGDGDGQLIETHPTLAFKALIDQHIRTEHDLCKYRLDPRGALRSKRTSAGRKQRIALLEQGLNDLAVPVTEQIRARWQHSLDWIDATICALIAAWRSLEPESVLPRGDPDEGAIYLRRPGKSYDAVAAAITSGAQVQPQVNTLGEANAVVVRLGENGPGGMNQQDTVDLALLANDLYDIWMPIDSAANFNLCANLQAVGGHLYLAFGDHLVLHVLVDGCNHDRGQRMAYPGEQNPWPVQESHGWVHVAALHEVAIGPDGFQVRRGQQWEHGFGHGRAAARWARVLGNQDDV